MKNSKWSEIGPQELWDVRKWGKPLTPQQQERAIHTSPFNKSLLLKIPQGFDHWYEIRKADNSLDEWRNDKTLFVFEKRKHTTIPVYVNTLLVYVNTLNGMPRDWRVKWQKHLESVRKMMDSEKPKDDVM